jgi:FKBP-type peptidyl-prolyl cis-trans isomerase
MQSPESVLPPFVKLPSGVEYVDIRIGKGEEAAPGKSVSVEWVLRDRRGYFVGGSKNEEFPFIYRVGNEKAAIQGFDEAIRGMRVGGRRRFTVPPELGYKSTASDAPGPIPSGFGPKRQIETKKDKETWSFEVELTKAR